MMGYNGDEGIFLLNYILGGDLDHLNDGLTDAQFKRGILGVTMTPFTTDTNLQSALSDVLVDNYPVELISGLESKTHNQRKVKSASNLLGKQPIKHRNYSTLSSLWVKYIDVINYNVF